MYTTQQTHRTTADNSTLIQDDAMDQNSTSSPAVATTKLSPSHHSSDHIQEFWLKIGNKLKFIEWIRNIQWMNQRGPSKSAYIPTNIEQIANVVTHGIWIIPAICCAIQLLSRSDNLSQYFVATVYGTALILLFFVSTFFHCAFYCNHNRQLRDILHRCDRAMIYIFIAGSYLPWLSLSSPAHSNLLTFLKWFVWTLAALGIIYQQIFHERYRSLETVLYVVMGLGPSIIIIYWGKEFNGLSELKIGGFLYILGIVFFKADGRIPFAHAIWHLFVVIAAAYHYFAILHHLYPTNTTTN